MAVSDRGRPSLYLRTLTLTGKNEEGRGGARSPAGCNRFFRAAAAVRTARGGFLRWTRGAGLLESAARF